MNRNRDYEVLLHEVAEMRELLQDVTSGAKELNEPMRFEKKEPLEKALERKRSASSSAWAKSKTSRASSPTLKVINGGETSIAGDSPATVTSGTKSKGITMGSKYPIYEQVIADNLGPGPAYYNVSNQYCSNRRPTRNVRIASGNRFRYPSEESNSHPNAADSNDKPEYHHCSDNCPEDSDSTSDASVNKDSVPRATSTGHIVEPSSRAYSFPKASRSTTVETENLPRYANAKISQPHQPEIDGNISPTLLDVSRADKWIRERQPAAIMMQPHSTRSLLVDKESSDETTAGVAVSSSTCNQVSSAVDTDISRLAYKSSVQNSVIMRSKSSVTPTQALVKLQKEKAQLGPGQYNVTEADRILSSAPIRARSADRSRSAERGKPVLAGKIYSASVAVKPPNPVVDRRKESSSDSLGSKVTAPDSFGVDDMIDNRASAVFKAESKPTPQLLKKRYWEEKARDAREVHDNMLLASESMVRSKSPSAMLASRSVSEDIIKSHPNLRILKEKRKHEEDTPKSYDVKYSVVEKSAKTPVNMNSEIESRQRLQDMLNSKAGVIRVQLEKQKVKQAQETFYGPQLQIPWAPQLDERINHSIKLNAEDPGYTSPLEEVEQLLASRNGRKQADKSAKPSLSRSIQDTESATASAFLRSSFAADMVVRRNGLIPMREPTEHEIKSKAAAVDHSEYLGPQLPVDWASNLNAKTPAVKLDKGLGRDSMKVITKGIQQRIEFGDRPKPYDDMGPGKYNLDDHLGENARGVVEFNRMPAREDAIGPNGERPAREKTGLAELIDDEDDLLWEPVLDIDFGVAKDAVTKRNFDGLVFKKEVIPQVISADIGNDHVGGTWFKGMADEALSRPAVVSMHKQTGRETIMESVENKALDDEIGINGRLDLDVNEWKPHLPPVAAFTIADPKTNPRFSVVKDSGTKDLVYEPNSEFGRIRTGAVGLEMAKQQSRWENSRARMHEEEDLLQREVKGKEHRETVEKLIEEREVAITAAKDFTSKLKQLGNAIDMSKQRGRTEQGRKDEASEDFDLANVDKDPFFSQGIGVEKVIGGAGEWRKEVTKREERAELHDIEDDNIFADEELIIDPSKDGLSSAKPVLCGPSWSSSLNQPRFAAPQLSAGNNLVYENTDPGKFLPGRGPIGSNFAGGLNMGTQSERPTGDRFQDVVLAEEIGEAEELILSPKLSPIKKRTPSSGPAWETTTYDRIAAPPPTAGQHLAPADSKLTDPAKMKAGMGPMGTNNVGGQVIALQTERDTSGRDLRILEDEIGAAPQLIVAPHSSEFVPRNLPNVSSHRRRDKSDSNQSQTQREQSHPVDNYKNSDEIDTKPITAPSYPSNAKRESSNRGPFAANHDTINIVESIADGGTGSNRDPPLIDNKDDTALAVVREQQREKWAKLREQNATVSQQAEQQRKELLQKKRQQEILANVFNSPLNINPTVTEVDSTLNNGNLLDGDLTTGTKKVTFAQSPRGLSKTKDQDQKKARISGPKSTSRPQQSSRTEAKLPSTSSIQKPRNQRQTIVEPKKSVVASSLDTPLQLAVPAITSVRPPSTASTRNTSSDITDDMNADEMLAVLDKKLDALNLNDGARKRK